MKSRAASALLPLAALAGSGGCGRTGVALSPGPDAAAPPADSSLADTGGPDHGIETAVPATVNCGCPPGDYWIEVKSDPGAAFPVDQTFRRAYVQKPIEQTCVPEGPWSYYREPLFTLYGCAAADQTRDCIQIDPARSASMEGGVYLSSRGRAVLNHPPVITDFVRMGGNSPGLVLSGSYTATATEPDGTQWNLHGSFRVCVTTRTLLLP